ncbi:MAG TPA: DUF4153 domain-containing protein [Sphingomicrobium sp.]|nr:DUF4153 domain-containing protein [Sphingomicrobium sp.]
MADISDEAAQAWPERPWLLATACALGGLAFHLLTDAKYDVHLAVWRQAAGTFVGIATLAFVLTVERRRLLWAIAFAAAWGVVIALVGWFTASYNVVPTIFEWPFLSGILAVMVAAPLFQTVRDQGRWSLPYDRLHSHAWADAVIGAASLAFTGIVFLLAWLIAGLFDLIGIEQITRLLQKEWFEWTLAGAAFGAAAGLLRERDRLLPLLQRLVRIVLAVLAPPLAVALILFLASIPFTGLEKFWKSGVPATPLLLAAAAGAILLANTVFAEDSESRSQNRVLRWSSLLLVAVALPLAAIAALSIGIRVDQYGWTPERMWGVVAVIVAIAYGIAGWYSIWRGRLDFDAPLRPLQTALALGLCGLALFLALPILDFGAISAHSQLARLDKGKLTPAQFDWAAMAFDFGPAGRAGLSRISRSGAADMRTMAATALKATNRWDASQQRLVAGPKPVEISVFPANAAVPADLRQQLLNGEKGESPFCSEGGACRVYPQPGGTTYIVFMDGCANLPAASRNDSKVQCSRTSGVFERRDGQWLDVGNSSYMTFGADRSDDAALSLKQESNALDRGDVRIVPVQKRQLVVGGKPAGGAF